MCKHVELEASAGFLGELFPAIKTCLVNSPVIMPRCNPVIGTDWSWSPGTEQQLPTASYICNGLNEENEFVCQDLTDKHYNG